jgi:Uma2 family endonuclease
MIQTATNLTFEEYLTYDDGTDNLYELIDGELVMVPLPTADHSDVVDLLSKIFWAEIEKLGLDWIVKRDVGTYVGINPETGKERSRTPDLCVITQEQWNEVKANKKAAAVLKTPPLLTVEVVSPGSKKADYKEKESEYKNAGVREYWIIDLPKSKITVLSLINGDYQKTEFTNNQLITSGIFPELSLTAKKVLSV